MNSPNFREASHALVLSPLRGNHLSNNSNLDRYAKEKYSEDNNNYRYIPDDPDRRSRLGLPRLK
jgi:hypothetical protein